MSSPSTRTAYTCTGSSAGDSTISPVRTLKRLKCHGQVTISPSSSPSASGPPSCVHSSLNAKNEPLTFAIATRSPWTSTSLSLPVGISCVSAALTKSASTVGHSCELLGRLGFGGRGRRAAWLRRHQQPVLEPERDPRFRLDAMAGHELELVALEDPGDHDLHLHQAEVAADALVRPAGEGEPRLPRPLGDTLRQPSVRVEAFRVRPEVGVMVADEGADQDLRAGRDVVAADLVVLLRHPRHQPDRRPDPQRLVDHAGEVLERARVLERRPGSVQLLVDLRFELA